MPDSQLVEYTNVALDATVGAWEIPCGRFQKASVQISNPTLALGSLDIAVTRSVARGFSNTAAYTSPVSITSTAPSGPHDIQGFAFLHVAVSVAGTSGLRADLTIHLETTVP